MTAISESDVTLRDGTGVHIRPIRAEDDRILVELFEHLSPQSIYQRFFTALPELPPGMARYLANVNDTNRMALVAEADGHPIAVGRYERTSEPDVVELGLIVLDEWQHRGLGRLLLRQTLQIAGSNGIDRFRADVLSENRPMLRLLAEECEILSRKTEGGVTTLLLRSRK